MNALKDWSSLDASDPKYRVATKHGYLKTWMDRSYVNPVESLTVEAAGLEGIVDRYHSGLLPEATQRSLARAGSLVLGGQGMRRCDCQGTCDTKRCACFKNGQACNSRCHKNNTQCKNCGGAGMEVDGEED